MRRENATVPKTDQSCLTHHSQTKKINRLLLTVEQCAVIEAIDSSSITYRQKNNRLLLRIEQPAVIEAVIDSCKDSTIDSSNSACSIVSKIHHNNRLIFMHFKHSIIHFNHSPQSMLFSLCISLAALHSCATSALHVPQGQVHLSRS